MSNAEIITRSLSEAHAALEGLMKDEPALTAISLAADALIAAFRSGGHVVSCGNGGSMSDAMHFAEELSGRYQRNRAPLPASAISDPGHITCVANDFGYEFIFSRYIEAHGRAGDVLLAISTSGQSPNILNAVDAAKKNGMKVIGLTGKKDSPLTKLVDISIVTPGGTFADRVQELHIKVIHIMIELVERAIFPQNYS
jgi:D-sedoheptulose 7-phosphate isomerase